MDVEVTEGHPIRLEMAFRWSGTLLGEESLTDLIPGKFEERLMGEMRGWCKGALWTSDLSKCSQPCIRYPGVYGIHHTPF